MEIIISLALISLWWLCSLTILLPLLLLLIISKTFRDKWFSFFFTKVLGNIYDEQARQARKRIFERVKTEYLADRDKNVPLEILEIGIGGGANLEFYPENSNLTALDMNVSFEKYFNENKKKHQHVNYKRTVINRAENMVDIVDSSFDIVICTYVLCSVSDMRVVLKEVLRVLQKGGKFIFAEHVAFPKNALGYIPQAFANPLWRIFFDGCCLTRDIRKSIESVGFEEVHCKDETMPELPIIVRKNISGVAIK